MTLTLAPKFKHFFIFIMDFLSFTTNSSFSWASSFSSLSAKITSYTINRLVWRSHNLFLFTDLLDSSNIPLASLFFLLYVYLILWYFICRHIHSVPLFAHTATVVSLLYHSCFLPPALIVLSPLTHSDILRFASFKLPTNLLHSDS